VSDAIDGLIEENATARAELMEAIDALSAERRLEGWYGPESWSVKDILAHLARWQESWSGALTQIAAGLRPTIEGFTPNPDDQAAAEAAFNADSVALAADQSWEHVLGSLRAARERHDEAVRGLRVLDPDRYAEGRTAHRLADAAGHDREHIPAILEWRREHGL
jgi:uncharacterized damage-inducible protein DinB